MKDQVEIERELASTQEALVYANKEKWKYKDRCIELEKLLKECRDMINNHCSWQVMDRPNHYVKKIENDIYEPLLTKINEVLK